ncbi:histidine phosphatase superfamily [Scheffersomyces amazonensis]|uniref:histidine phosphatase superfamily n=1 Tax=Scheffersomyces amazonensis TaxID=1078765 RepID=UPI00315C56A5
MSELYFLRHARRIDHELESTLNDSNVPTPIFPDYPIYDPSLSSSAIPQVEGIVDQIISSSNVFNTNTTTTTTTTISRKNIFIHFSPYLRCCQTADLLVSQLSEKLSVLHPQIKFKYQMLCDFALSEWIHDKMRNKPPFQDSNDAYNMYTPNLKTLTNKNCCSNFRPLNTLGPYNGPDLSYSDYQSRCKTYFKKLLATYDKPAYIRNKDIIIVISHGYVINNFLSYFINHPIFEEIPEAKLNFASRVLIENTDYEDDSMTDEDELTPENSTWKLFKDALQLLEREEDLDSTLNLDTDIVYYKTNFIKRDEFSSENSDSNKSNSIQDNPRPSFKISRSTMDVTSDNRTNELDKLKPSVKVIENKVHKPINYNPICPSAKDWDPRKIREYQIKNEFILKMMNDESFKKAFDITNHPSKPVSPEVSPNSEPTRNNSVIDLSKLVETDENYRPMKLRYSSTPDIPMSELNSKVNSQVNLAQYRRSPSNITSSNDGSAVDLTRLIAAINMKPTSSQPNGISQSQRFDYGSSSNENSVIDLPKFGAFMNQNRKRSLSNPSATSASVKDSYFPRVGGNKSSDSESSITSPKVGSNEELHVIKEHHNEPNLSSSPTNLPQLGTVFARSRSLNHKRDRLDGLLLSKLQKDVDVDNTSMSERIFSLSFHDNNNAITGNKGNQSINDSESNNKLKSSKTSPHTESRSRGNSIKFIPSVLTFDSNTSTTNGNKNKGKSKKVNAMFYNLDSDDEGDDEEDEFMSESDSPYGTDTSRTNRKPNEYLWFGHNRN